jgi:hypothetical protein
MKKTFKVTRKIVDTKKGQQVYYFQDGKRITAKKGRTKWVRQNIDKIDKPYSKTPIELTAKEIKTFKSIKAQTDLYRYKGKPINKFMTELLAARKILNKNNPERDITKLFDDEGNQLFKSYGRFEQAFELAKQNTITTQFTTIYGLEGWRDRTQNESAISLLEGLEIIGYDGWKIEALTIDNKIIRGLTAVMEAVREFEEKMTEEYTKMAENVAAMSFTYELDWDFTNKIITLNLWDKNNVDVKGGGVTIQTKSSDPIKRTKK